MLMCNNKRTCSFERMGATREGSIAEEHVTMRLLWHGRRLSGTFCFIASLFTDHDANDLTKLLSQCLYHTGFKTSKH